MNISLKYGKQQFEFELHARTEILAVKEPEYTINKEIFCGSLLSVLPSEKKRYLNVAIIVSDKTRLCGYPEFLPWVTETLQAKGVSKENITFYIAYGTHARQTEEESLNSYGDTYNNYRFVHHDCNDDSLFEEPGITARGTRVTIRKDILNSSLIITFGAISHHYFAGYGGGRKLLFPGLAKRSAVYQNHGLFLDLKTRVLATGCQPGMLKGNPLAEDLEEIDQFLPSKISIHGILNNQGKVCQLTVGTSYKDFEAACRVHDSYYRSPVQKQFDLVVTSSGGYPKDINFIQAHKSVHHAAAFVKDGGKLIILSECIDKIGSSYFLKYLEAGSFEAAFSILEKNYEGNGGTALSMMTKTKRIKIYMMTSLDQGLCKTLNVTKVNEEEIQKIVESENGTVALIENASLLVW
jgi:nickel-dependent lactate racemase